MLKEPYATITNRFRLIRQDILQAYNDDQLSGSDVTELIGVLQQLSGNPTRHFETTPNDAIRRTGKSGIEVRVL